jgi:hypothetical protein
MLKLNASAFCSAPSALTRLETASRFTKTAKLMDNHRVMALKLAKELQVYLQVLETKMTAIAVHSLLKNWDRKKTK